MHVMTKGFCGDKPVNQQAWNTRIVVQLMNSAKGDLMLDRYGNLTTRNVWSSDYREMPFDQHTAGDTLALIGVDGWLLTVKGAHWILENCPPESKRDVAKLQSLAGAA